MGLGIMGGRKFFDSFYLGIHLFWARYGNHPGGERGTDVKLADERYTGKENTDGHLRDRAKTWLKHAPLNY